MFWTWQGFTIEVFLLFIPWNVLSTGVCNLHGRTSSHRGNTSSPCLRASKIMYFFCSCLYFLLSAFLFLLCKFLISSCLQLNIPFVLQALNYLRIKTTQNDVLCLFLWDIMYNCKIWTERRPYAYIFLMGWQGKGIPSMRPREDRLVLAFIRCKPSHYMMNLGHFTYQFQLAICEFHYFDLIDE